MSSEIESLGTPRPWGSSGKTSQAEPLPPLGSVSALSLFIDLNWKLCVPIWNDVERIVVGRASGIACFLPSSNKLVPSRLSTIGWSVRLTRTTLAARNRFPVVR